MKHKKRKIAVVITIWLMVVVVSACIVSTTFTYVSMLRQSEDRTIDMVRNNVEDVSIDIEEMAAESILSFMDELMEVIPSANAEDPDSLMQEMRNAYTRESGVEVNVVDTRGIITMSSVPEYVGFDMHQGEQSSMFLVLLDGSTQEVVDELRPISYDNKTLMKYAGRRFADGSGFLEVGLSEDMYYEQIRMWGRYAATNRRIGEDGYLLVCNSELEILNSFHNAASGLVISDVGIEIDPAREYHFENLKCDVFDEPSYVNINEQSGIYVIGVCPVSESADSVETMIRAAVIMEIFLFGILFVLLYILLKKRIVSNIVKVNHALHEITEGNLDERVDVRDTYEFDELSTDINETVDRLKDYIAEEAARFDEDLTVAKTIQNSVLPGVFPPFPEKTEFELFASMHAAKEVGGDFYDFFLLGDDTLGFMIADVSGKSIPGAMFMMTSRAVIRSFAERGLPPAEVFTRANEKLCEGNTAGMFLTAWMGYLNLRTGEIRLANAGHNPPVLIRDGKAGYVNQRAGLVLAAMEDTVYREQTIRLNKGDLFYLYTDGVTEATNQNQEMYGEERLQQLLSFGEEYPAPSGTGITEAVCKTVTEDLNRFVMGAEQSDDITMLCIRYIGEEEHTDGAAS
ncbi:MAG: SpoIIE family protein phosphatase [Lachnospiraceae bacterium]|nr:SpoIIE family protein phosphatase [Lachnospiraceae bacterium]